MTNQLILWKSSPIVSIIFFTDTFICYLIALRYESDKWYWQYHHVINVTLIKVCTFRRHTDKSKLTIQITIFHWLWQSGLWSWHVNLWDNETILVMFSKMLKFGHTNWQLQASFLKIGCLTIFRGSIQQLTISCLYVMNAVIHYCEGSAETFIFLLFLHWFRSKVIKNKKS